MADAINVERRRRELEGRSEGEEQIDIVAVDIDIQSEADPPVYTAVLEECGGEPSGEIDSAAPPLSYDAVIAGDTQPKPSSKVLTVEAPPSYLQLFGKEETDGAGRGRGHRRLTEDDEEEEENGGHRFLNLLPKDTRSASKCGLVLCLLLFLTTLAVIMITLGFMYYKRCLVREVPLYLLVAGLFLLVEIALHSILWTAQKLSNDEPLFCVLRRCDCIALFLLVWLVLGSVWIFKAGKELSCNNSIDYIAIPEDSDYSGDYLETVTDTPPDTCPEDCPGGVYVFTVFLILFQYLTALVLGICCCTSSVRSRRH